MYSLHSLCCIFNFVVMNCAREGKRILNLISGRITFQKRLHACVLRPRGRSLGLAMLVCHKLTARLLSNYVIMLQYVYVRACSCAHKAHPQRSCVSHMCVCVCMCAHLTSTTRRINT